MVSPGMSFRVRPFTACTLFGCKIEPVRVLKITCTSSRKMIGVFSSLPSAAVLVGALSPFASSCSVISMRPSADSMSFTDSVSLAAATRSFSTISAAWLFFSVIYSAPPGR